MAGCTAGQLTWRVLVPSARPMLMVGVNQVIMLSLNMVIIASMIGAGGLGYDVLTALRRLDIGAGLEAGLAIVALAIALDRVSQAAARRGPIGSGEVRRYLIVATALIVATWLGSLAWPAVARWPEPWTLSTGTWWSALVAWINVNYFDTLEAIKNAVLLNLMLPIKRFLLAQPWPWVILLTGLAGLRLGGVRLAALCVALPLFILVTGQWENAMLTVYLTAVSVLIAALIGIPLGIASATRPRLWRMVQAVARHAPDPALVRLPDPGRDAVPGRRLHGDAGDRPLCSGAGGALHCARHHAGARTLSGGRRDVGLHRLAAHVARPLPLALPQILLGINQTIMLAISMLVITALVGTRDLGQEVYVALAKADIGRGLVAGLCVAFIAITADRLVAAATGRVRQRLGLA